MKFHRRDLLALVILSIIVGCGQRAYDNMPSNSGPAMETQLFTAADAPVSDLQTASDGNAVLPAESTVEIGPTIPKTQRRIIFNTEIGLVVQDYTTFESKLPNLVAKYGGFISKSETNRRYSNQQTGVWVARIPVDSYTDFLQGVGSLGFAESRLEDAQDVTEQYVDIEARIANSQKLEERIISMLEEHTGKISDLLEIERELARVREVIERMEGQKRVLADRSALATITIKCREEKEYTPPAAPTLDSRIGNSWKTSLASLQSLGENSLVTLVGIIPWLLVIVPAIAVFRMTWRAARRKP
jgi:hypothetical protein